MESMKQIINQHELMHQKYKRFFVLTLASLIITMLARFIVDIVGLSGGSIAVIGIIAAVIIFICEIALVISIMNIVFDTNVCLNVFSNPPNLFADLENQNRPEDDDLLLQDI